MPIITNIGQPASYFGFVVNALQQAAVLYHDSTALPWHGPKNKEVSFTKLSTGQERHSRNDGFHHPPVFLAPVRQVLMPLTPPPRRLSHPVPRQTRPLLPRGEVDIPRTPCRYQHPVKRSKILRVGVLSVRPLITVGIE